MANRPPRTLLISGEFTSFSLLRSKSEHIYEPPRGKDWHEENVVEVVRALYARPAAPSTFTNCFWR